MNSFKTFLCGLAAMFLAISPLAHAADAGGEAEARAAFTKLVGHAKKKQTAEFKKLIARADLAEMETMEKEQPGMIGFMMDMISKDNPKDFKAEIKGNVATFTKVTKEKSKDGSSTTTETVRLVREDNQWKFGKPR
jgi:hypothetical protein